MTEFRNLVCAAPLWLNFPAFLTAECSHVTNILVNGKKVDMIGSIFLVFLFIMKGCLLLFLFLFLMTGMWNCLPGLYGQWQNHGHQKSKMGGRLAPHDPMEQNHHLISSDFMHERNKLLSFKRHYHSVSHLQQLSSYHN